MNLVALAAAAWTVAGLACIAYGLALRYGLVDVQAAGGPGR